MRGEALGRKGKGKVEGIKQHHPNCLANWVSGTEHRVWHTTAVQPQSDFPPSRRYSASSTAPHC